MPQLMTPPPFTPMDAVTEVLHGVPVTDWYRWLEDQDSPRTREWLNAQHLYARSYLDSIPGRDRIRDRIRELLDVETYDSIQKIGRRYFFRKREKGHEQFSIYLRESADGPDQLLIDPADRGTGPYTAIKPLRVSPDGRLLLYEVKEGGERTGTFELLEIPTRRTLPDVLPRGYLRGFAFAPDSQSFYYVHDPTAAKSIRQAVLHHVLGTFFGDDKQVFTVDDCDEVVLSIVPGRDQLGFLVCRYLDKPSTDFYLWPFGSKATPKPLLQNAAYRFGPLLKDGRILAITDRDAPNSRIVELCQREGLESEFVDVIPTTGFPIRDVAVTENRIYLSYTREDKTEIKVFDLFGRPLKVLPIDEGDTVRFSGSSLDEDELLLERESFTKPIRIYRHSSRTDEEKLWADRKVRFDTHEFNHAKVWFTARDGVRVPMFLVGRHDVLERRQHPAIMTSYGGYGVSMTPQFSVFVAFMMERGCLFALPNIRGGSEFGVEWHQAAKGRNRQVAFDDFICAAESLMETGRAKPRKLAIFGGSNSGLLVGAAMTQRPDLFRAAVCMVPLLDMLRYHLFDNARSWKDELGTAADPGDLAALLDYSPYHRVREGVPYPATMIVSGDSDQTCNPLHARKMTARLQAANVSEHPIILDYSRHRGHSPVLPLGMRIDALTDRMAFLCDQLGLLG
jgi:prolyl oligopeptidase